ncbi:unnamed protein product [Bursaphelenchus xylophilus]|uniref:(pine wood nematode) hypothetical protein n=1 Tax=Bursaphelenchus xylophilus TaxID=6326 RepID=A0A1I7RM76_BURXY|nr:unnamed protein product [Bursaphelenchus xylophilus]CAG9118271.1 unnamed protein product [Bursaphelenchus xylophilus]
MNSVPTVSVQRQLKEDWDNREFEYFAADNIKKIGDSLSQFAYTCGNKISTLNDKVVQLERQLDFLEAKLSRGKVVQAAQRVVTKTVTPVSSHSADEARLAVLTLYKRFQRLTPTFWWDYELTDYPLPVFREVIKKQFIKNAHVKDLRIIDRKIAEGYKDIESIEYAFYNPDHVRNYLFRENLEAKPKDFLSKFLLKID